MPVLARRGRTSHSLLGRPGNNPDCHHRALSLAAEGRRERAVKVQEAGPAAFAIGRFELVEEALDGSPIAPREEALDGSRIARAAHRRRAPQLDPPPEPVALRPLPSCEPAGAP
jgi:hypothetical protein